MLLRASAAHAITCRREENDRLTSSDRTSAEVIVIERPDFTSHYTLQLRPNDDTPSFFTAVDEQLGLQLVPDTAPLGTLPDFCSVVSLACPASLSVQANRTPGRAGRLCCRRPGKRSK